MTQTAFVTGASGFIAASVLHVFLEAGYNIRAAVRSETSAEKVRKTHGRYGTALSFAIVPGIAAQGVFNKAVRGIDVVTYTTSPFFLHAQDVKKRISDPAYNGTVSILKGVKDFTRTSSALITSSVSAVLDFSKGMRPGYTYTETDWNPTKPEELTDTASAYFVSKATVEKAAFEFVDNEKPYFSITTILPPLVYGANENFVDNLSNLNTSSANL